MGHENMPDENKDDDNELAALILFAYDYIKIIGTKRLDNSEDEIDIILHGTPEQKRKLYRKSSESNRADSSGEDDFETEMNKELQETVRNLESKWLSLSRPDKCEEEEDETERKDSPKADEKSDIKKFYDDIYFDSDDDEIDSKKARKKNPVLTNDDLLYDPDMDDEDQKWVDQQRMNCQPKNTKKSKKTLPHSDAILNCPACMTTLCRDCQRHEIYATQYRAMFVSNCDVDISETIKYPKQNNSRKRKWKKSTPDNSQVMEVDSVSDCDLYNPVKCSECQTVVAVRDKEEIYYFYNVLASY